MLQENSYAADVPFFIIERRRRCELIEKDFKEIAALEVRLQKLRKHEVYRDSPAYATQVRWIRKRLSILYARTDVLAKGIVHLSERIAEQ